MRWELVDILYKELLGPRAGINEIMKHYPDKEYTIGLLAPKLPNETDPTGDISIEETVDASERLERELDVRTVESSPEDDIISFEKNRIEKTKNLSRYKEPNTMGISFNIKKNDRKNGSISVLILWAKYRDTEKVGENDDERKKLEYKRIQYHAILRKVSIVDEQIAYFNNKGHKINEENKSELALHILPIEVDDKISVSIYMNNMIEQTGYIPGSTEFLYQVEIRVLLNGLELQPNRGNISGISPEDREQTKLTDFWYLKRQVYGKGNQCSIYWKDVDPESFKNSKLKSFEPFTWKLGEFLGKEIYDEFFSPDVRSTYLPIYIENSPEYGWSVTNEFKMPELSPVKLSELSTSEDIRQSLDPLWKHYYIWVKEIDDDSEIPSELRKKITTPHLDLIEAMKQSISLLIEDENILLSFCFANKAISLQNQWSGAKDFKWRPFQLAYMLIVLESLVDETSDSRILCDLLGVSTGAGKTEAYLVLIAFLLSYRRRKSLNNPIYGIGTAVISRYTLRLLTSQQFRRTVNMVLACEYLRVYKNKQTWIGWIPRWYKSDDYPWGRTPFSCGIWVGNALTPNYFEDGISTLGARTLLEMPTKKTDELGEPAQLLNCPACNSIFAFSLETGSTKLPGITVDEHTVFYLIKLTGKVRSRQTAFDKTTQKILKDYQENLDKFTLNTNKSDKFPIPMYVLEIRFTCKRSLQTNFIEDLFSILQVEINKLDIKLERLSTNKFRPGYFFSKNSKNKIVDFEIYCLNLNCSLNLNTSQVESLPSFSKTREISLNNKKQNEPFQERQNSFVSNLMRFPVYTTDEQVFKNLPSVIISTVDKFARMPYNPRSGSIFGLIDSFHERYGYYKEGTVEKPIRPPPITGIRIQPPSLIIQDELHLIEGALGSMVGIYETAVDKLTGNQIKYIASSATAVKADRQVNSIFMRKVRVFPLPGKTVDDTFFVKTSIQKQLEDKIPGRVYFGISTHGKGMQTITTRILSRLYFHAFSTEGTGRDEILDKFWTIVNYYNTLKELGGSRSVFKESLPERLSFISNEKFDNKYLDMEEIELSGRIAVGNSLPSIISNLEKPYPANKIAAIFATSMFGVGVDISRLNLMLIHRQPKTTTAYIQASGRVGRNSGGLVIVQYSNSISRDLNHYEYFANYHHQLKRNIEPSTVNPFTIQVIDRAGGPVAVAMLRLKKKEWAEKNSAGLMKVERNSKYLTNLIIEFQKRATNQYNFEGDEDNFLIQNITSTLKRDFTNWNYIAKEEPELKWSENTLRTGASNHVVLGSPPHNYKKLRVVYKNAPNSLRNVEETTTFYAGNIGSRALIRSSQFLLDFGPGSIVETGSGSGLVLGIMDGLLEEYREKLEKFRIKDKQIEDFVEAQIFQLPSNAKVGKKDSLKMYTMKPFPYYAICNKQSKHRENLKIKRAVYVLYHTKGQPDHYCPYCRQTGARSRFLEACSQGHISDVQWGYRLHQDEDGKKSDCQGRQFFIKILGSSLSEYRLICNTCSSSKSFTKLFYKCRIVYCRGKFEFDKSKENPEGRCTAYPKVVQRQASYLWMPKVRSFLTIPSLRSEFEKAVYDNLKGFISGYELSQEGKFKLEKISIELFKKGKSLASQSQKFMLKDASDDDIKGALKEQFKLIRKEKTMSDTVPTDFRQVLGKEFRTLMLGAKNGIGTENSDADYLKMSKEKTKTFQLRQKNINLLVSPVLKLEEVMVLASFERVVTSSDITAVKISVTDLAGKTWLPGIKGYGEGIFISCKSVADFDSLYELATQNPINKDIWLNKAVKDQLPPEIAWKYHPVYIWWHTLAHYLNRNLGELAGFAATALKERVYFIEEETKHLSGILIYTTGSSSDGTLGGLISLYKRIPEIVNYILTEDCLSCSNDPLCKKANQEISPETLIGALCYSCILISETSCSELNRLLDRRILFKPQL